MLNSKPRAASCAAAFAAWAVACAGEASSGALPPGAWKSPGLGYVAVAEGGRVKTFDVSSAGCVEGPAYKRLEFRDLYGAAQATGEGRLTLHRGPTRDFLERLDAPPTECGTPVDGDDAIANFNLFAATFADYYAFFAERGVDWPAAVEKARPMARADLFGALVTLVEPLNDGHVSISARERSFDPDHVVAPGATTGGAAWSWKALRGNLRDYLQGDGSPLSAPAQFAANHRLLYGRLNADTGYVAILAEGGWAEGESEETPADAHAATAADVMDFVLGELSGARAMIVDLRVNSGGFDAVSFEVASRFASDPAVAFTRQAKKDASPQYDVVLAPSARTRFEGPIAVLIGPNTVSAGESLAQAFAVLPQARLIGQPTRGILSDAIPKTLPNGWEFTLSVETLKTPEGDLLEVAGVQPDERTAPADDPDPDEMWGADIRRAAALLTKE